LKSEVLILQQTAHETPGSLTEYLTAAGVRWRIVELFKESLGKPIDIASAAGLIVLGGPMNVDEVDRYPFLTQEVSWLQAAVAHQVPTLGICLGAQLLAKAFGARVFPNHVKEIGWYSVQLLPEAGTDPLLSDLPSMQTVFQWHGDTFDLPREAVLLAIGDTCRHQAFRIGSRAWAFQFHIEMTEPLIESWLQDLTHSCAQAAPPPQSAEQIRARVPSALKAMREFADPVLVRFARLCVEKASG